MVNFIFLFYISHKDVCEPDWSFYNGSCYFTSDTCKTWPNASLTCRAMGTNLAAIESQEENVYIQHRHNGDKAWIGLNDIATEGLFTWVDGCPDKFRGLCSHSRAGHGYMWNDVDCSACHRFTCKKGRHKEVILILYRNCMTAFLITGKKALKQKETKQIRKKKLKKKKQTKQKQR